MTWLRGSTDNNNLLTDFYNLLRGANAASNRGSGQGGNGVLAGADAWDGWDDARRVLRSPATVKPLYGQYTTWRGAPRFAYSSGNPGVGYDIRTGRPTFSGTYSGGATAVYFACYVSTANTAGGALNGTVVTWFLYNAETGAQIATNTATGWTGATDTKLLTAGVSLTLTAPSGQFAVGLTNGVRWMRGYGAAYTDGVDYNPDVPRRKAGTLVISNTSGGANNYTEGVDYDVVGYNTRFPEVSTSNLTVNPLNVGATSTCTGGPGALQGVIWRTGGGAAPPAVGATYHVVDMDMYACYLRFTASTTSAEASIGITDYHDPITGRPRNGNNVINSNGDYTSTFSAGSGAIRFLTTATAGNPYINYWISVKPDKIILVGRGDPAFGASLGIVTLQRYDQMAAHGTADKHPWIFWGNLSASWYGTAICGFAPYAATGYWGVAPNLFTGNTTNGTAMWNAVSNDVQLMDPNGIAAMNPNPFDGKWWFWRLGISSRLNGASTSGTGYDANQPAGIRGKLRGITVPHIQGFASLDEIVDVGASVNRLMLGTNLNTMLSGNTSLAITQE